MAPPTNAKMCNCMNDGQGLLVELSGLSPASVVCAFTCDGRPHSRWKPQRRCGDTSPLAIGWHYTVGDWGPGPFVSWSTPVPRAINVSTVTWLHVTARKKNNQKKPNHTGTVEMTFCHADASSVWLVRGNLAGMQNYWAVLFIAGWLFLRIYKMHHIIWINIMFVQNISDLINIQIIIMSVWSNGYRIR